MTELWRESAAGIAARVRAREVSALEAVESVLDRLAAVNPAINAVVEGLTGEALEAARAIDARIAAGEDPGPLAGVAVTTKVNVDQKGCATTNGVRLQKDLIAPQDSPVVANLRKAGAVIVGRTNTPAFSLRWFTRNSLHGATVNPRNPRLTPGGSSGGAAAAVAAGIGPVGQGTDIAGSIRYPAYACGLHGIRPSLGRVPAVNFSAPDRQIGAQLMAVSGPIARHVGDLRLALGAMAARDVRDPWWAPAPMLEPSQKRAALCLAPSGMKVAPEVQAGLREAAARLTDAGWQVDEMDGPDMAEAARLQAVLWLAEFRRVADMVEREGDPDAAFVYAQMQRHCPVPDLNAFLDALQRRAALVREWETFFEQTPLILCPVSGEPPFADHLDVQSEADFDRVFAAQLPQIAPPFMGLPGLAVTLSLGEDGVPVGAQLLAGRYQEETLLQAAEAIEARGPAIPVAEPRA